MNFIKKFAIFSLVPCFYFSNFSSSYMACSAEEKTDSSTSFEAVLDDYVEEEKLNIKICDFSKKDIDLKDLEVTIIFDKRIFRFIKKDFQFLDTFKTKIEDIDKNNKILKISVKNRSDALNRNQDGEIFDLDLNIKKKIPAYESDIKILISCGDIKCEETKHVKILDKNQIENIIINSKIENSDFKFDKNTHKYNLSVPDDEKYIIFDLETIDKNKKTVKKKLKKAGSTTVIKIGNYEFEDFRNEKKKSDKKTKKVKSKKAIKTKKGKSRKKVLQKNKRTKKENSKSFNEDDDEYEDEDEQYGIRQREDGENQKNNEHYTKTAEETLKNNEENSGKSILNIIKIAVIIIILILIVFWIFLEKIKSRKPIIPKNEDKK